MSVSGFIT